jgi:type II secretion system protein J
VLDSEAHVREEARRWNELALLLAQLREDLSSATGGHDFVLGSSGEAQLRVQRFGEVPGMPPRRVGYRLREGTVEYLLWPAGTPSGAQPASAHAVLGGVADLRFTALRDDGSWTPVWAPREPLPRAVAIELVLSRGERITRLYPLR